MVTQTDGCLIWTQGREVIQKVRSLRCVLKRIENVNKIQIEGQCFENRKIQTLRAQGKRPQKLCCSISLRLQPLVRGYSNCSQSTQAVVLCGAARVDEDRKHYRTLGKAVNDGHTH